MPENPMVDLERKLSSDITGGDREFNEAPNFDADERQVNRIVNNLHAVGSTGSNPLEDNRLSRLGQVDRDILSADEARIEALRREQDQVREYEAMILHESDLDVVRLAANEWANIVFSDLGRWDQYGAPNLIRSILKKSSQDLIASRINQRGESIIDRIPGMKKYSWARTAETPEDDNGRAVSPGRVEEDRLREEFGMDPLPEVREKPRRIPSPDEQLTREERKSRGEFLKDLADYLEAQQDVFIASVVYDQARPSYGLMAELANKQFGSLKTIQLMSILKPDMEKRFTEAVPEEKLLTDITDVDLRVYLLILQAGAKSDRKGGEAGKVKVLSREADKSLARLRLQKIEAQDKKDTARVQDIDRQIDELNDDSKKVTPHTRMMQDLEDTPQIQQLIREIAERENKDIDVAREEFVEKVLFYADKMPFYLPNNETKLTYEMRDWIRNLNPTLSSANEAGERLAYRLLFMTGLVAQFDDRTMHRHGEIPGTRDARYETEPFAYPVSDAAARLMHWAHAIRKETRRGRDDGPDAIREMQPENLITDFWRYTKMGLRPDEGPDLRPYLWEEFFLNKQSLKALNWEEIGDGAVYQWAETIQLAGEKEKGIADLLMAGAMIEPGNFIKDKNFGPIATNINKLADAMAELMVGPDGKPWMGGNNMAIRQRLWEHTIIASITANAQDFSKGTYGWGFFNPDPKAEKITVNTIRLAFREANIKVDWQFIKDRSREFLEQRGFVKPTGGFTNRRWEFAIEELDKMPALK